MLLEYELIKSHTWTFVFLSWEREICTIIFMYWKKIVFLQRNIKIFKIVCQMCKWLNLKKYFFVTQWIYYSWKSLMSTLQIIVIIRSHILPNCRDDYGDSEDNLVFETFFWWFNGVVETLLTALTFWQHIWDGRL